MRPATTTEAYRLGQKDMLNKVCEWLEKNAENYIWYSDYAENSGDSTCGMNNDFINDLRKEMEV